MFDDKRFVYKVPFVRRMDIVKTKNFVVAMVVRLYKVVAGKIGARNVADKQVFCVCVCMIYAAYTFAN